MKPEPFRIRRAGAHDVGPLLSMMRELAVFERYAEHFHVTAPELLRRGLAPPQARPEFIALVAEPALGVGLCAYAVLLLTPFTYDLRPTLTLKELYVSASHRRQGVAEALLAAVKAHAVGLGAGRIRWQVLPDNDAAQRLYRRWGGEPDPVWESWEMALPAPG